MLGICFFIQGGEYTGESVWEGEKGVAAKKSSDVVLMPNSSWKPQPSMVCHLRCCGGYRSDRIKHGDQARENLTFRNPCNFKDCQFLVRFERGLRLRIPLWWPLLHQGFYP